MGTLSPTPYRMYHVPHITNAAFLLSCHPPPCSPKFRLPRAFSFSPTLSFLRPGPHQRFVLRLACQIHRKGQTPTSIPPPSRLWCNKDSDDKRTRTTIARETKEKEAERRKRASIDFNDAPTDKVTREARIICTRSDSNSQLLEMCANEIPQWKFMGI